MHGSSRLRSVLPSRRMCCTVEVASGQRGLETKTRTKVFHISIGEAILRFLRFFASVFLLCFLWGALVIPSVEPFAHRLRVHHCQLVLLGATFAQREPCPSLDGL